MKKLKLGLIIAITSLIICSCSDKDSWADNYITNLAELTTNSDGTVITMRLDDGQNLTPTNNIRFERPDTTYRCVCIYTQQGTSATIADYAKTFSSQPITDTTDLTIKDDPCQIQSTWLSGQYFNARMLVQGKDQPHIVAFIDRGITTYPNGSQTLTIQLHHDQNGDSEAFTRTIYLSCPLYNYAAKLQRGRDSVCLVSNGYRYISPY